MEALANTTTDLFEFLDQRGHRPDLDSEMMQFLKDHKIEITANNRISPGIETDEQMAMDSMSFAQRAIENATEKNREFTIFLDDIQRYIHEVSE